MPEERGSRTVDVNDLLAVITTWECSAIAVGERAPDPVIDCEEYCATVDPTKGPPYASCLENCINSAFNQ